MREQLLRRGGLAQRKTSRPPGLPNEPRHPLHIQVRDRRLRARCAVERPGADQLPILKVLHQRGIHRRHQFLRGGEPAADQVAARPPDQGLHFGMFRLVIGALHENKAQLVLACGRFKLPLGGGNPLRVLEAVVVAEQANVNVAKPHLFEIHLIGTAVGGGDLLEEKRLEEPAHQGVTTHIVAQSRSFLGELFLHAADEDSHGRPVLFCRVHARNPTLNQPNPPGEQILHHGLLQGAGLLPPPLQGCQFGDHARQQLWLKVTVAQAILPLAEITSAQPKGIRPVRE